jgi:hypothetical protein
MLLVYQPVRALWFIQVNSKMFIKYVNILNLENEIQEFIIKGFNIEGFIFKMNHLIKGQGIATLKINF